MAVLSTYTLVWILSKVVKRRGGGVVAAGCMVERELREMGGKSRKFGMRDWEGGNTDCKGATISPES